LGEGAFVVFETQRFHTRQPCSGVLDAVGGDLHLAQQREHVRIQPHLQQHVGVVALRLRMGLALDQQLAQIAQRALADRYGGLVHGKGIAHGIAAEGMKAASLRSAAVPD
jgi:hypothetical protein